MILGGFCIGLMPPFLCFKGRCYLFFVCSGGPWLLVFFLVVCWALKFWFRITSFQKVAAFPAKLWSVRVVVSNLCCFIRWFLYRADAPFLCFLGRCCLIFVFSGGLWLLLLFLVVFFWIFPFGNKFLLIQKKKKNGGSTSGVCPSLTMFFCLPRPK